MASEQYGQLVGGFGSDPKKITGSVTPLGQISGGVDKAATAYEKDYEKLDNLPSINEHILIGDSDFEDIGLHFMTNTEIRDLLGGN